MLGALSALDWTAAAGIPVRAGAYLASLSAAGTVLVLALLPGLGVEARRVSRRLALASAGAGALLTALLVPLGAAFLGGGSVAAMADPVLLGLVLDGPQGTSAAARLIGLAAVAAASLGIGAHALAAGGAVLVAVSFALVGHTVGEPRAALALSVTVHTLAVAFWIGALRPLHAMLGAEPAEAAAAVCERFARLAAWAVGAAVAAGVALLLMIGGRGAVLASGWGQILALKVVAVGLLLWIALRNRDALTPALGAGVEGAAGRLRRSIRHEAWIVAAIILATASLTAVGSP